MPITTKWDMLVPQDTNVVHNLIRNPSFEYNDQFFAGTGQYWYYYSSTGTRSTTVVPQTSNWASRGSRALALSLGTTATAQRYVAYTSRETAFDEWSVTVAPSIANTGTYTGVTYTTGNWAACVFILTPYGVSLATMNDDDPVQSGNNYLPRSWFRQIDLTKGRSQPFFTAVANFGGTTTSRDVAFTMPAAGTHPYPANSLGYAVFVSTPTLTASGRRIWRLITVKGGVPDGLIVNEIIPADDTGASGGNYYGIGSTTFLTANAPASVGNYYVYDSSGNEQLATFIGNDASQPALGLSNTTVAGSTYKHHLYLEWYVDTNYTAATSPFIACAYDYKVSVYDRGTASTLAVTNYVTGTDRLAAQPTDRLLDVREGRTKFLVNVPTIAVADAGRDLEIRIEIVSPTGVYTNNAAILYIDCVQLVDISYRGDDDYNWDDVEFTYFDADMSGGEWRDVAPSYRTSSGTLVNGIDVSWYWLGETYMGWNASFGMANRDRYIQENTAVNNTYGGTARLGYAQSFLRSPNGDVGTYVPIDNENFGASVLYSTTGTGMPEVVTSSQSYGAIDGGIVQRQVSSMRTMQLSIEINGSSAADLHNKRRRMINALKFDQLAQQSTRTIRYRGSGTNVLFSVTYTAGLEFTGWQGVSFTENATVQFLCADPYAYAEISVLKRFVNPPIGQDTRFLMAYKKGDNQPWMYTGMKDYQTWLYGQGTISAASPSAGAGVTGTISVSNSSTLTSSTTSTQVTVSVAYFVLGTADVGRTLVNTATGQVIGVIASVTNTTTVQLVANATVSFTGTTWIASTNRMTISAATLTTANDAGKYVVTTAVPTQVIGKIANVSSTTVTFEQYVFTAANLTAVAINLVGTTTFGATQTFTGVGTAFASNDIGETVYKTANAVGSAENLGDITAVASVTSVQVTLAITRAGTLSKVALSNTINGVGTDFSANDVNKLLITSAGLPIGIIGGFISATQVTVNTANNCIIAVAAGTTFQIVRTQAQASTSYALLTPELVWSGGFKKYHIGIIESPDTGTSAVIVGGFDNGSPAMGYGFSKYHAVFLLDGKQNTSAGNYANTQPRTGTITTSATFPYTVTGSGTDFTPSDVGAAIYNASSVLVGTIGRWNSATSVNLMLAPNVTVTGASFRTASTAAQPNSDYSSVISMMTRHSTSSVSGYFTIVPTAPITAIYQESPFSVLVAGTFEGYGGSGTGRTDIRLIRIKGWMRRRATTSPRGAADVFGSGDEDIEVIMWDALAGWGTPVINCITTDLNGNIYVGGANFTTSNVWYVGRPNDGTYGTLTTALGKQTAEVYAITTDTRFPTPNVFIAIAASPYLNVYPYYNSLSSVGVWKTPPTITTSLGTSQQSPDNLIYGFLRTQSGDIIVYGAFSQWGGTYGATVNGLARLVPKITTYTQTQTYVDATPAVPAAGSYTQPGIASGESVLTMADFSYPPTTGSYAGTGERLLFGGSFSQFNDGRYSLGLGYLDGSGNASSVRRMSVSDLGLSPPPSSTDYPYINAMTTTNRNRFYYANNQVNSTDNLVGPTAAILITKSTNAVDYANNSRYFQSGTGGYATVAGYGIPQTLILPVEVRGTANAYPIITATLFWRTTIYEIVNVETGARIRFDELYGLRGVSAFSGITETITIDFRPGYRSVVSNIRGNLMQYVSPDSDLSDFYLVAPSTTNSTMDTTHTNTLSIRYTIYHDTVGSNTPTVPRVTIWYTPKFWSFDVPQLFKDAPDTPLL